MSCTVNDVTFRFVKLPAGRFRMGSEKNDDEKPIYEVRMPSFWLAVYPCTQALYEAVTGKNPSGFKGKNRPVENVTWEDAQAFIGELNERGEGKAQQAQFRLPSEAEWEYAAQAGGDFAYAGSNDPHEAGWYTENSHEETKPVGLKKPNAWGLYDLSGNVWEWCEDYWHADYQKAPADGSAWIDNPRGSIRVLRGGGWNGGAPHCRTPYRNALGRFGKAATNLRPTLPAQSRKMALTYRKKIRNLSVGTSVVFCRIRGIYNATLQVEIGKIIADIRLRQK